MAEDDGGRLVLGTIRRGGSAVDGGLAPSRAGGGSNRGAVPFRGGYYSSRRDSAADARARDVHELVIRARGDIITGDGALFDMARIHPYWRDRMLFPRSMTTTEDRKILFWTLLFNGFNRSSAMNIICTFSADRHRRMLVGPYLTHEQLSSLTNYLDVIIRKYPDVLSENPTWRAYALKSCTYGFHAFYDFGLQTYVTVDPSLAPVASGTGASEHMREAAESRKWFRDNYPEDYPR